MKTNLCADNVKQYAASMWNRVQRPTVCQTLHYDISLLPTPNAPKDRAFRLHLGGTHRCPLWKVLLIAAVALVTVTVVCKCKHKGKCKPNQCNCQ